VHRWTAISLRQLRGTVIPEPRRDKKHRDGWKLWRRRHQYGARQAHQRWHAYADAVPRVTIYNCRS
jgi:hypothetical protein